MPRAINRLQRPPRDLTTTINMSRKPAITAAPLKPGKPPRTAYLVLGMHRSGTSAVTQLLALAGANLPANVMPGDEHNAKGYFEPWKIAIFNDERLRAAGSAWDDVFAFPYPALPETLEIAWGKRAGDLFDREFRKRTWPLMKDPRATVLLPMWRSVLADRNIDVRCVIPVRHPLAVAGSLARRDGFAAEKSILVWSAYMLAAEAYTRDLPRAFTAYDALLNDWRGEAARIEAAHGAPLPRLTAAASAKIDQFLTPDLRHNTEVRGLASLGWAGEIAQQVLDWCEATARGEDPDRAPLARATDQLARRKREFGMLVSPAARDLAAARADLLAAQQELVGAGRFHAELQGEVARLEAGWRADQARLKSALSLISEVETELDRTLAKF